MAHDAASRETGPMRPLAHTLVAIMLAAAWPSPLGSQSAAVFIDLQSMDDDPVDPGFAIWQMGPLPLLPDRPGGSTASIQLDTDACGLLKGIEDSRSIVRQSGLTADDSDDDDEDPAGTGEELFDQWLSAHAEIAVVNGAVGQWCDDDDFDDDDPDPSEIA